MKTIDETKKQKHAAAELSEADKQKIINTTTSIGVLGNIVLSAFKLIAGITGHSTAMISDAVHSLSDVFATLIAFIGLKISQKSADKEHPYGHERYECFASITLAVILMITGAKIGIGCIQDIVDKSYLTAARPGLIALAAAIVSIVTKEAMFWYTLFQAKRIGSSAFKADAWHHRSDAMSSVGALIGIAAARMGYPIMDSVAGIIICIVILYVGIGILKDAADKMVDSAEDPVYEERLKSSIDDYAKKEGLDIGIDSLMTRKFGEKVYVDLEISVDGDMKLKDAHAIAEKIHDMIEKNFSNIKHVMVHTNPAGYSYSVRA